MRRLSVCPLPAQLPLAQLPLAHRPRAGRDAAGTPWERLAGPCETAGAAGDDDDDASSARRCGTRGSRAHLYRMLSSCPSHAATHASSS